MLKEALMNNLRLRLIVSLMINEMGGAAIMTVKRLKYSVNGE